MSNKYINFEDIMQVTVGAAALSVPIAFSEESWELSRTLPTFNIIFLFVLSLIFVNLYSFQGIFQGHVSYRISHFLFRTIFVYFLTAVIVSIILFALNRFPIYSETFITIKRVIILSFPASMGAVVVDSFDKE
jgi:uncharacterized membrane protein